MANCLPSAFHERRLYSDESALFTDPGFSVCEAAVEYQPRRPEESVLYRVVAENLESFLTFQQKRGRVVPRFVENDLRDFLDCGILERGLIRVHCDASHEKARPWSGGRGSGYPSAQRAPAC
jgi:hypothetical protein